MSTETVSPEQIASTRKIAASIESDILRRLAEVTQDRAAAFMDVSPSTVSRMRERISEIALLMAAIGCQTTGADSMVVSQNELAALKLLGYKYLQTQIELDRLRG
ncbi:CII family transcriptional regulator [Herminiimonas contaminans]|uniref:MarR family transcriptional regulator n=1 Tax=Herminiimonas contaminans TaxID=1111140 RepID=A0ABS0ERQ6_9BURK|nr:CII family transcriptional regulator [Herminiimonas contaminans]MBF8177228.1 MarR family transcriptional regulator [Herminiimonas contaminans]